MVGGYGFEPQTLSV